MLAFIMLTVLVLDLQQTANIQVNFTIYQSQNECLHPTVSFWDCMRPFRTSLYF